MADDKRAQSEFNMAVSYLNRLNSLFYVCDEAAMSLNAHQWFHAQLAIFRELSTEMKPEELNSKKDEIREINNLINSSNKNSARFGTYEISSDLYEKLHEFELYLRSILDGAGLQKKMKEDPGNALS